LEEEKREKGGTDRKNMIGREERENR